MGARLREPQVAHRLVIGAHYMVEKLDRHDRASFSCGDDTLDRYFREQAGQDQARGAANCFVLVERSSGISIGYCTLTNAEIARISFPSRVRKKLGVYRTVPAVLVGRLAIDSRYQRRHLGEALLAWAVEQMQHSPAACAVLVVDAYPAALGFYLRFGFCRIPGEELRLYYPLDAKLLALAGEVARAGEG